MKKRKEIEGEQIGSAKKINATPEHPPQSGNDGIKYWLMKAEPESRFERGKDVKFSISDLKQLNISCWDGVRNYEARNNMRKMRLNDICLFYHSNCKIPGIAGAMKVVKEAYADHTAWDKDHPYFDPKTDQKKPKWFMVDVEFVEEFSRLIPLKELQEKVELKEMQLIKRGRLSVQPVSSAEYSFIRSLLE